MAFCELNLPSRLFRRSASERPPLRIGLRLDGPTMTACAQAVVQDLLLADYIRIIDVEVTPRSRSGTIPGNIARTLFRCVDSIYDVQNDPLAARRIPPSLADRKSDELPDVCLDLALTGAPWWRESRHGTWCLQVGAKHGASDLPPFAFEMLRGIESRPVELHRRMSPEAGPEVLCRADFPLDPFPSARRNRIGPLWGGSHFFLQKLHELHRNGAIVPEGCAPGELPKDPLGQPGLWDVCRWTAWQVMSRIGRWHRRAGNRPVWHMAIRRSAKVLPESPTEEVLSTFRWMHELGDQPAADPFLFEEGGRTWLFFESIDRHDGHGHIACGWIDETGRLQDVRTVLHSDTHLSYPHLLRQGEDIYLLPESAASGGLDLYRARRFPDEWEKVARLLDFPCVDSTVFRRDGKWWMFTSPMATPGSVALTWIFKSDRLEGPWEFQPTGLVSCSAATARAAGEVIDLGGRTLRPSQDCARSYGRALVFNEILSLGSGRYEERMLQRIETRHLPGMIGLHTYNRVGDWEVIDGLFDACAPPVN
ncbi:MAG: hypothetical protein RLZZ200_364 [Pseudomonadota bacterium]|jgi:hypothetical protein